MQGDLVNLCGKVNYLCLKYCDLSGQLDVYPCDALDLNFIVVYLELVNRNLLVKLAYLGIDRLIIVFISCDILFIDLDLFGELVNHYG